MGMRMIPMSLPRSAVAERRKSTQMHLQKRERSVGTIRRINVDDGAEVQPKSNVPNKEMVFDM